MSDYFQLINDYAIEYDGDYFDLHKQSSKRSLVNIINYIIRENNELKQKYSKCRDCKYADVYIPTYAEHWIEPKCRLNVKRINSSSKGCKEFEFYNEFEYYGQVEEKRE